jgi:hypothetical protein
MKINNNEISKWRNNNEIMAIISAKISIIIIDNRNNGVKIIINGMKISISINQ